MKIKLLIVAAVMVMIFSAAPVTIAAADPVIPAIPQLFYGTVTINGTPAPAGTTIEARGEGVMIDSARGNPVTTTQPGLYSSGDASAPNVSRLYVQGNIPPIAEITFYVNGVLANESAGFSAGIVTELNLTASVVTGGGGGGGGTVGGAGGGTGGSTSGGTANTSGSTGTNEGSSANGTSTTNGSTGNAGQSGTITVTGLQSSMPITLNAFGQALNGVTLTDATGTVTLDIPAGTTISAGGASSTTITAAPVDPSTLPQAPSTAVLVAYEFGPGGTTFSPPVTLTIEFNPAAVPQGVQQENMSIAYWDAGSGTWFEIPGTVDTASHSITALVGHFSTYAIVASGVTNTQPTAPTQSASTETATTSTPGTTSSASSATSAPAQNPSPVSGLASINWLWVAAAGVALALITTILLIRKR